MAPYSMDLRTRVWMPSKGSPYLNGNSFTT